MTIALAPADLRLDPVRVTVAGHRRWMRSHGLTDEGSSFDVRTAYSDHGSELFGFALNACGDRGLAEECVQETFTRAWRARERYDTARGSLRTWLFAIARNVVVDQLRSRGRRPVRLVHEGLEREVDSAHDHVRTDDHLTLVWALAQLSANHRRVVVAVRLEGLTYEQLGRRDGVPVATLRTRMYHALRALREMLEGEEER
ncbi:sigma-70 family RNA polymerase sigma factor [Aeromicrobium sp. CF4.19]|uniref:sigma-70 family RNA polymerase sigma factor n=1 Tax=Aeromicrobium sp. CF4.19 TaxID=3373082 RepID=UPI003EE4701A